MPGDGSLPWGTTMSWWTIPAIVGGAVAGLVVAYAVAIALGGRQTPVDQQTGGGPRWRTDVSGEPSRYAMDNRLSWNPAAISIVLIVFAAMTGLALGLALS